MASYLHCPTCSRAYNVAAQSACPYCPVAATLVDPAADIVSAADELARALARATPAERAAALSRVDHLSLASLAPPAPIPPAPPARAMRPMLVQMALAVMTRVEARLETRPRLRRATGLLAARVRALAA